MDMELTLISTHTSVWVIIGLSTLYIGTLLFFAFFSPLSGISGPFLTRFTRLWYLKKIVDGDFEKTNLQLHKKYGAIVRIAPNEYSISDPTTLKVIYGHGTTFVKAPWYRASGNSHPDIHDLFTDEDPIRHRDSRRRVANLFSMTSLIQYEDSVAECTDAIIDKFKMFAVSSREIDMQSWLQFFAFDMIGLITVSKKFGFIDHGTDVQGILAALHSYLVYSSRVGVFSEFHPFLSKILSLLPGKGFDHLIQFTQEQIHSTKDAEKEGDASNFAGKLLEMHLENPEKLPMHDILGTCLLNVGAGSDTTSISLSAILYNLIKAPQIMAKLRHEIDEKRATSDSTGYLSFKSAHSMPYLQACIKEGLRVHPATGLPLARVVPRGGVSLCGKFFPEGTVVGVNAWVMNYDKVIFGEDADTYRPERWLVEPEKVAAMERTFSTFGHGSRTCIGKNISLMEISRLIPEIVSRFDFILTTPGERLETRNNWFVKQTDFKCRLSLRSGSA
ncbi:cytochrome protein [Aureobasidium pullulans]|uniref:Cytochrome protein n=1 Tax=Aureobasidium pullulans TaxID=5580 RepID=A0A4S8YLJ2_AURPU|nr:cytochrome protein [Aureobasidium pullulans]